MERIAILGATGWFGRTFLSLLSENNGESLLLISKSERRFTVGDRQWAAVKWNDALIAAWEPTVILNFAFATRDLLNEMGHESFIRENQSMLRNLEFVLALPSVQAILSCATGASLEANDIQTNPYGYLKKREEELVVSCGDRGVTTVVPRIYSVSGPWVARPHSYALPSFVAQAKSGRVKVEANQPTFRSYTSVKDILDVGLRHIQLRHSASFESGRERVEMRALAKRAVELVNPAAEIEVATWITSEASEYVSPTRRWKLAYEHVGVNPLSLD